VVQRVGWGILAVLVIGGLVGLLGRGPLSKTTRLVPASALEVKYERLARFRTPTTLEVRVIDRQPAASGRLRLKLIGPLTETVPLQRVVPIPIAAEPLDDGAIFTFAADSGPRPGSMRVAFVQEPGAVGLQRGEISVDGRPAVPFAQFVLP
jgi:hypothetical protein